MFFFGMAQSVGHRGSCRGSTSQKIGVKHLFFNSSYRDLTFNINKVLRTPNPVSFPMGGGGGFPLVEETWFCLCRRPIEPITALSVELC